MQWVALFLSLVALGVVLILLRREKQYNKEVMDHLKKVEAKFEGHDRVVNNLVSRLSLIIRMLRQHMKDGEVLVEVGTANDRKLVAALQAAGIYVQFDEFPQKELGRSRVISEMLRGEESSG